jgi:hypothetical protein
METRRRITIWAAALAVIVGAAACGAPAGSPATSTLPQDLVAVWMAAGETGTASPGGIAYVRDPGGPSLRPGPVSLSWECFGVGRLEVALVRNDRPGQERLDLSTASARIVVGCPTSAEGGPGRRVRLIPGLATGGENALVVRSAIEPSAPMTYTVVIAQAP